MRSAFSCLGARQEGRGRYGDEPLLCLHSDLFFSLTDDWLSLPPPSDLYVTDFIAVSSRLYLWNTRSCKPPSRPQVSWTCPSSAHSGGFFLPLLLGRGSGSGFLPRHTDEEQMQLLLMLQTIRRARAAWIRPPVQTGALTKRDGGSITSFFIKQPLFIS